MLAVSLGLSSQRVPQRIVRNFSRQFATDKQVTLALPLFAFPPAAQEFACVNSVPQARRIALQHV